MLFIQLGRVPQPLFDYTLAKGTLPPVFEGQDIADLALNLGNWYFNGGDAISLDDLLKQYLNWDTRKRIYPSKTSA